MKSKSLVAAAIAFAVAFAIAGAASAQRYMEKLDRGLVAVKSGSGYFLSWRLFGTDLRTPRSGSMSTGHHQAQLGGDHQLHKLPGHAAAPDLYGQGRHQQRRRRDVCAAIVIDAGYSISHHPLPTDNAGGQSYSYSAN